LGFLEQGNGYGKLPIIVPLHLKPLVVLGLSSTTSGEKGSSTSGSSSGHSKTETILDILPVEDMYNLRGAAGYVFFEGKTPPLIAAKSNYDDPRLPWHKLVAGNPIVKVWH